MSDGMSDVLMTLVSSPSGLDIFTVLRSAQSAGSAILSSVEGDTNEKVMHSLAPMPVSSLCILSLNACLGVRSPAFTLQRKGVDSILL